MQKYSFQQRISARKHTTGEYSSILGWDVIVHIRRKLVAKEAIKEI